jgi:hypothetical protein
MFCSDLPLEIVQNNLTHCYYLALHCRTDGEVCVAAAEAPSGERYRCPLCQTLCHCTPLGEGGTLRPLHFWNRTRDAHSFAESSRRLWLDFKNSRLRA